MLKTVVIVLGVILILKCLFINFNKSLIVRAGNEITKHKKYKLINLFTLVDTALGVILLWLAMKYSY